MSKPAAPFVARPSVPRLLAILVASIALVVAGFWIAGVFGSPPTPGKEWFGWVAVAFFGFGSIVVAARVLDRDDQIVVDDRGIYWRRWSDEIIPWAEVRQISERRVHNQQFMCIQLKDPTRHTSKRLVGRLSIVNEALGFEGICINALGTDRSYADLREAVLRHWPRTV